MIILDEGLAATLPPAWPGSETVIRLPTGEATDDPDTKPMAAHRAGNVGLLAALAALEAGRLGLPETDLTLALTAMALLRLWARWLPQFAASSIPYLLENFIRRSGRVSMDERRIFVELDSLPLDVVIELAGYTAPLARVAWLNNRTVEYQLRGVS
jgi:hypothetical protein